MEVVSFNGLVNEAQNSDYCNYYFNHAEHLPTDTLKDYWAHIELGAGNYGLDGHTKKSQAMTVLMDLSYVSNATNYIDELPESDQELYDPNLQYAVLFDTLEQLIFKKGPHGIFHVNDLYTEYANYAAEKLKEYVSAKGYEDIIVEAIPGDYTKISPRDTLKNYGKFLYDSAHLKNPEITFYNYGLDGEDTLSNENSRYKAREKLQQLANLSYKGLYFFPLDANDMFIPNEEKEEYINKGIFYHRTNEYQPVAYYFPEGDIFPKEKGRVYWINHNSCNNFSYSINSNNGLVVG
jgi:hypothetical protein